MSENPCPFIDKCPFFNSLHSKGTEEALKIWYCKSEFEKCERYLLRIAEKEVPPNLWPNGKVLNF